MILVLLYDMSSMNPRYEYKDFKILKKVACDKMLFRPFAIVRVASAHVELVLCLFHVCRAHVCATHNVSPATCRVKLYRRFGVSWLGLRFVLCSWPCA